MVIWDFNEDKNYIFIDGYKVLDKKDAKKASNLLYKIDLKILLLFEKLKYVNVPEIQLLIKTPFSLQEMQKIKDQGSIKFEGLNKPKNIIRTKEIKIGPDGSLRAKNRIIFLTLRDSNDKIKNIKQLYSLICHELTHTALNHVRWRNDDHDEKFNYINKLLFSLFL